MVKECGEINCMRFEVYEHTGCSLCDRNYKNTNINLDDIEDHGDYFIENTVENKLRRYGY